jgi:hypothetical protein
VATKLLNSNIRGGFGKINQSSWRGFTTGTVLLKAAKTTPVAAPPSPQELDLSSGQPGRLVNVEFLIAFHDPSPIAGTTHGWNS